MIVGLRMRSAHNNTKCRVDRYEEIFLEKTSWRPLNGELGRGSALRLISKWRENINIAIKLHCDLRCF
jgi:hypothetical protein